MGLRSGDGDGMPYASQVMEVNTSKPTFQLISPYRVEWQAYEMPHAHPELSKVLT